MDTFIKSIFPKIEAAGMPFKNQGGCYSTLLRGNMCTDVNGAHSARGLTMAQTMTYLGNSRVVMGGGPSDLDGLNKNMLTPEGQINFVALGAELKSHSGLPATSVSSQLAQYEALPWADNQVALLVNMLRFALLIKLDETSGQAGLEGSLPRYDDGHVVIHRNKLLDQAYPVGGKIRLPMSVMEADTPNYMRVTEYAPVISDPILDLRGFTDKEALLVLLLCSSWKRQSKYRLDFDMPMLANALYYRADQEVNNINTWMEDLPADLRQNIDRAVPSSEAAWRVLAKYVVRNRLYNQFSVALYLVASVMQQFVPATAEGQMWLQTTAVVRIPQFRACRGRFPFLNAGDAALVSHRAMAEWGYINGALEKVNLMAAAYAQAYQTGLGVRALRRNHETDLSDIYATEMELMTPDTMLPAAAAEALRMPVPLSGMQDTYVYFLDTFEEEVLDRYLVVEPRHPADAARYAALLHGHEYRLPVITTPFAGVPTLLLPLNPLPEASPFALHGRLEASSMTRTRFGWETSVYQAWHWAWAARLCGYDTQIESTYLRSGAGHFYAPNESSWTWPILAQTGMSGDKVRVRGLVERNHQFVYLPPIQASVFQGYVDFRFRIISHEVSNLGRADPALITDYYGSVTRLSTSEVHVSASAEVRRVRGYIQRGKTDFQFVETVQAGLIPPRLTDTDAIAVEPPDPDGQTRPSAASAAEQ